MVAKNKTLIITICSNTKKREGETQEYDDAGTFARHLTSLRRDLLYRARDRVRTRIMGTTQAASIQELVRDRDYNGMLYDGPDFHPGTNTRGYYLPAAKRYRGRFYQNLGPGGASLLLQTPYHVLILSGLYGLLTPQEPIQCYSCDVTEHPSIANTWIEGDRLTSLLLDYIGRNGITRVIEMTAMRAYRQLIAWESVRDKVRKQLFHCFGRQLRGDALLSPLGVLAHRLLSGEASELESLSRDTVVSVPEYGEKVHFLSLQDPVDSGIAVEEWVDPELQTLRTTPKDAIGRMRRNILRVLGYLLQIGDEFVDYSVRIHRAEVCGSISHDLARGLRMFGEVRNRVEYRTVLVSERDWETALSCYRAFERWVSRNKYDERIELEAVFRADGR